VNEQPIDHILGVLGKLDVTAVAADRAAHRQARTVGVGAVMLIVGRDGQFGVREGRAIPAAG
jgi:hypothetical protein